MDYKYKAFISYRHRPLDQKVAVELQKLLETYKPPKNLKKRLKADGGVAGGTVSGAASGAASGTLQQSAKVSKNKHLAWRIFRDESELPTNSSLGKSIEEALENSEFLICICSEEYRESKWCNAEIDYFKKLHNNTTENIITLTVHGNPEEIFPPQLLVTEETWTDRSGQVFKREVPIEPLSANISSDSEKKAFNKLKKEYIRIVAPMLHVDYNNLVQREVKRKKQRIRVISFAVAAGLLSFSAYSGLMVHRINKQNQDLENINLHNAALLSENRWAKQSGPEAISALVSAFPENYKDMDALPEAQAVLADELGAFERTPFRPKYTLKHTADISFLSYADEGKRVVTADTTGVYFWDSANGKLVNKLDNVEFYPASDLSQYSKPSDYADYAMSVYADDQRVFQKASLTRVDNALSMNNDISSDYLHDNYEKVQVADGEDGDNFIYVVTFNHQVAKLDAEAEKIAWISKPGTGSGDLYFSDEYVIQLQDGDGYDLYFYKKDTGETAYKYDVSSIINKYVTSEYFSNVKVVGYNNNKVYVFVDNKVLAIGFGDLPALANVIGEGADSGVDTASLTDATAGDASEDSFHAVYETTISPSVGSGDITYYQEIVNNSADAGGILGETSAREYYFNDEISLSLDSFDADLSKGVRVTAYDTNDQALWSYDMDDHAGKGAKAGLLYQQNTKSFTDMVYVISERHIILLTKDGQLIRDFKMDSPLTYSYVTEDGFIFVVTQTGYELCYTVVNQQEEAFAKDNYMTAFILKQFNTSTYGVAYDRDRYTTYDIKDDAAYIYADSNDDFKTLIDSVANNSAITLGDTSGDGRYMAISATSNANSDQEFTRIYLYDSIEGSNDLVYETDDSSSYPYLVFGGKTLFIYDYNQSALLTCDVDKKGDAKKVESLDGLDLKFSGMDIGQGHHANDGLIFKDTLDMGYISEDLKVKKWPDSDKNQRLENALVYGISPDGTSFAAAVSGFTDKDNKSGNGIGWTSNSDFSFTDSDSITFAVHNFITDETKILEDPDEKFAQALSEAVAINYIDEDTVAIVRKNSFIDLVDISGKNAEVINTIEAPFAIRGKVNQVVPMKASEEKSSSGIFEKLKKKFSKKKSTRITFAALTDDGKMYFGNKDGYTEDEGLELDPEKNLRMDINTETNARTTKDGRNLIINTGSQAIIVDIKYRKVLYRIDHYEGYNEENNEVVLCQQTVGTVPLYSAEQLVDKAKDFD